MIYFTAHTFKCVCHCIRTMFRVLGVYNFVPHMKNCTTRSHIPCKKLLSREDQLDLHFYDASKLPKAYPQKNYLQFSST